MTILFLDSTCPKPYTPLTLATEGLGGTEATVIRIAEALAALDENSEVFVEQHTWEGPTNTLYNAVYGPIGTCEVPDRVVVLRDPGQLYHAAIRVPKSKLYLWVHDLPSGTITEAYNLIAATNATVVCVSQWHMAAVCNAFSNAKEPVPDRILHIYNPLDANVKNFTGKTYDPYQLIWLSSPHKGLPDALAMFEHLYSIESNYRLLVANPGYFPNFDGAVPDGVTLLAPKPHPLLMQDLVQSLCLFYPNSVFPETFGLVLAEANALGVPVITCAIGAANEVISHPDQFIEAGDTSAAIEKVLRWTKGGRPIVGANPEFNLRTIAHKWRRLLK